MKILGINGGVTPLQHEPSAALVVDGEVIAAAEEERFVRKKNAPGLVPINAIAACLKTGKLTIRDIDLIVHPGETSKDLVQRIRLYMEHYFGFCPPVKLVNHQLAHMASAFYCAPYPEALCISYDGYGDDLSGALAVGDKNGLRILRTYNISESLGRFYSALTSYLGFEVAEAEYKVMGLAPYGRRHIDLSPIVHIEDDSFTIDPSYFRATDRTRSDGSGDESEPPIRSFSEPWYSKKLVELLGPPRRKGEPIDQRHRDIAAAIQQAFEEATLTMVRRLRKEADIPYIALAGGCALNCKANGLIRKLPGVKGVFVQPAASDRGLALGAALLAASEKGEAKHKLDHVFLGPEYSDAEIRGAFDVAGVRYRRIDDPSAKAAELLAEGNIIGWFQGRAEFGPRALGHRSILADPTRPNMKDEVNRRIKYREEFRPFAPAVLDTEANKIFDLDVPSPFMTVAVDVRPEWRDRLPAVVHVDGSARVQTVSRATDPKFFDLIERFGQLRGAPVVLNTSFNVRGEPIVESPINAVATFAASGLNALIVENYLIEK